MCGTEMFLSADRPLLSALVSMDITYCSLLLAHVQKSQAGPCDIQGAHEQPLSHDRGVGSSKEFCTGVLGVPTPLPAGHRRDSSVHTAFPLDMSVERPWDQYCEECVRTSKRGSHGQGISDIHQIWRKHQVSEEHQKFFFAWK